MLPKNSSPPINRSPVAAVVATSTEAEEDEDEELQLALALSKEEHDAEETKRRNDEVRLKMALEESKRTAQLDVGDVCWCCCFPKVAQSQIPFC